MKSFPLGHIVATPGALIALEAIGENALTFIGRHSRGDWGDLDSHDTQENEFSLENDLRLLSAYHLKDVADVSAAWRGGTLTGLAKPRKEIYSTQHNLESAARVLVLLSYGFSSAF